MELESEGERKEAAFQQTLGVKEAEITELQERIRQLEEQQSSLKKDHDLKVKQLKV